MDRFGILQELQDNWPARIGMSRIAFYERKLRGFDTEEMAGGIEIILDTCNYPPTMKELRGWTAPLVAGNQKVAPMIAENVKRRFSLKSQLRKLTRPLRRRKKKKPSEGSASKT